jgi:outer membrane protein OmpA-like peptidoglycan-associated protein
MDDKCPDTPKGWKVDATGCPLDQDKDGVADAIDKCPDTPAGVTVDKNGCPIDTDGDGIADYLDKCPTVAGPKENNGCPVVEKTAEEKETIDMKIEPVYFDYDKSNILIIEKAKIDKLVNLLKANSNYNVNMTGNTDSKGTEEYNMALSKRRIDSVAKTITTSGIKLNRISKEKPLGETKPAATNDTEEGRALNRRVEFEVIKTK